MNSALVTGAGKANFTRSSASEIWRDTPPPADSAYIIPLWLTGTVSANGWVEPAGPEICVHIGGVEPTWFHPLLEKECQVRPIQASFQSTLPRRYACMNSRPGPHCSAAKKANECSAHFFHYSSPVLSLWDVTLLAKVATFWLESEDKSWTCTLDDMLHRGIYIYIQAIH